MSAACGTPHPDRQIPCERPYGHRGGHQALRGSLTWGGRMTISAPPKIRPLPAGKPLAPYRPAPPAPPAGKFRDIPGQQAMDLTSDDPDALVDP